jgi:hypothetical protein
MNVCLIQSIEILLTAIEVEIQVNRMFLQSIHLKLFVYIIKMIEFTPNVSSFTRP